MPASGESTAELLRRYKCGDELAANQLLERYRVPLHRWAHGRLPPWARSLLETEDLVQDVLLQTLGRLDAFVPRRQGSLHAYMRQALLNRITDVVRHARRHGVTNTLPDDVQDAAPSPLEEVVGREAVQRYEDALIRLRPRDREAIVARLELGLNYEQVALALGLTSIPATQMAVSRAVVRLAREMDLER